MRALTTAGVPKGWLRQVWESPWFDVLVSTAASYLLLVPTGLLSVPPTVDQLTVRNPTVYDIRVAVSDGDGDGRLAVTTVSHRDTKTVDDVIDQGEMWTFEFRGQGRAGGELTLSKAELEAADWYLVIPDEVGGRLADLGAPPAP